jgi:hypothetical protein
MEVQATALKMKCRLVDTSASTSILIIIGGKSAILGSVIEDMA